MKPEDLRKALRQGHTEPRNGSAASPLPMPDTEAIEARVGPWSKLSVRLQESRAARDALVDVRTAQIEAERRIARAAIDLTETAVRSATVSSTLPTIGALTVQVSLSSDAVDQELTNAYVAGVHAHQCNLDENRSMVQQLVRDGMTSDAVAQTLMTSLEDAALEDIVRSHERMQASKKTISSLAAHALEHLEQAKHRFS